MKASLVEFERTTNELSRLLNRNAIEERLLSLDDGAIATDELRTIVSELKSSVDSFGLRQAQYAMHLVVLYGAFERLIEGLAGDAVKLVNDLVPQYEALPAQIRDNHRRKTLDALRDEIWLSRQTEDNLPVKLIQNLSSCESAATNYKLNALAFTRHGGNYRRSSIDETFKYICGEDFCSSVARSAIFESYLETHPKPGLLDGNMGAIDDLAERRNEIAHGAAAQQLLSREDMGQYLEFFRIFGRAAVSVLNQYLTDFYIRFHSQALGKISQIHYRTVVCLDLGNVPEGTWLEVGDPIAIHSSDRSLFDIGEITNIRTGAGDVSKLRTQLNTIACIDTSMRLRQFAKLYALDKNHPAAWLAKSIPD